MPKYRITGNYTPKAGHNQISYARVVRCVNRSPHKARYKQDIIDAIGHHPMQGGANGFFTYLLKRNYIRRTAD